MIVLLRRRPAELGDNVTVLIAPGWVQPSAGAAPSAGRRSSTRPGPGSVSTVCERLRAVDQRVLRSRSMCRRPTSLVARRNIVIRSSSSIVNLLESIECQSAAIGPQMRSADL